MGVMRKHDLTNKKTTTNYKDKYKDNDKYTFKEQSLGILTIETFDQSGEKTPPDQQKDNKKDKDKYI